MITSVTNTHRYIPRFSLFAFTRPWAVFGLSVLVGCTTPQGVSVRKNGSAPAPLADDSALYPKPGLSFALSPLDRVHIQILPLSSGEGRVSLSLTTFCVMSLVSMEEIIISCRVMI